MLKGASSTAGTVSDSGYFKMHWLNAPLTWISLHPAWGAAAVFLFAFLESLAVVGLFVPGAVVMFAAGALVGLGAMALWPTLLLALAGAIAGDGLSYWLGHHFGEHLLERWPLKRYPNLLEKGERFFSRHGAKSIFLGRFVGAVRPIIPMTAGMLGMRPLRFYIADILSALAWAPAHIILGMVFGASLSLAAAVATRLLIMLAAVVIVVWLSVLAAGFGLSRIQAWGQRALPRLQTWAAAQRADRQKSTIRSVVLTLLDPSRPETRLLPLLGAAFIAGTWMFLGVIEDVLTRDPLVRVDFGVYHLFEGLRTPLADRFMIALTELGDVAVLAPVIAAVLLWLLYKRAWRPATYWITTLVFGAGLTMAIKFALQLPRPVAYSQGADAYSFPSGHVTMSVVTFGFLGVLLAPEMRQRGRLLTFSVVFILVVLIGFSRLYLGVHWLSDVLGGFAFGTLWVSLLAIAYMRHPATPVSARRLAALVFGVFVCAGAWHISNRHASDTVRYAVQEQKRTIAPLDWWRRGWSTLPPWRIDLGGDLEQPMNVQWAGPLGALHRLLLTHGWRDVTAINMSNVLYWLDTRLPAMGLPVFPRVHNGRNEQLTLAAPVKAHPDQRMVLRLWSTRIRLSSTEGTPVWIGVVTRQTVIKPLGILDIPVEKDYDKAMQRLLTSLNDVPHRLVQRQHTPVAKRRNAEWNGGVLLATQLRLPSQPIN